MDEEEVLQTGLTAIWLMMGAPLVAAALPFPALDPLRRLIWPVVRRGKLLRLAESSPTGSWRSATLPQSFFTHFYVVGLAWNAVLVVLAVGFLTDLGDGEGERVGRLGRRLAALLLLFEAHLARRLYECLFVSSFDPAARMSGVGYVIALGYYVAVPLTLFLQSFRNERHFAGAFLRYLERSSVESLVGGGLNLGRVGLLLRRLSWKSYAGIALCVYGSAHQHSCHKILASLRSGDRRGKTYGIPRGDWFEWASCAHYLAEIVIYAGLLIASGGTHPAMWALLLSVGANLFLLAKPTHEWYLDSFEDYPKTRRALVPFVC